MRRVRFGTIAATIVAALLTLFVTPASAAYNYTASSLPWSEPQVNTCIGGAICGTGTFIRIDLTPPRHVSNVIVYAHDRIGDKHDARLAVTSDYGVEDGWQDVQKAGSYLTFNVDATTSTISLSPRGPGCCSYDEVYVASVQINP